MALRNYSSKNSQNVILISDVGSNMWEVSQVYPGLRYLRLKGDVSEQQTDPEEKNKLHDNVDDIDMMYVGNNLMTRGTVDNSLQRYGTDGYVFKKADDKTYAAGECVLYGGQWYVALQEATDQEITDESYFLTMNKVLPISPKDSSVFYRINFSYKVGDIIFIDDIFYIVKTNFTSTDSPDMTKLFQIKFDVTRIYDLEFNSWDKIYTEGNLKGLVVGSTANMWIKASGEDTFEGCYYYNNSKLGSRYVVTNKPYAVYINYKLLNEASNKQPKDLQENEWSWGLDPSQSYYTIWIGYKATDPDQSTDTKFIAINENKRVNTLYTSVNNPNGVQIFKPGAPVTIVPEVPSGKYAILLAVSAFNKADVTAHVTLSIVKKNGDEFPIWVGDINSRNGIELATTHVLNAGDKLGVNSDSKNVSILVSLNEE